MRVSNHTFVWSVVCSFTSAGFRKVNTVAFSLGGLTVATANDDYSSQ